MILSSLFFLLIFMAIFYNLIIPSYCNDITLCRLSDQYTNRPYQIFVAVIFSIMLILNVIQALNCPSLNTFNNILLATTTTIACWIIFSFVVYFREYFRMSFANVFGYLAMSTTFAKILPNIVNPSVIDSSVLETALDKFKPTSIEEYTKNGKLKDEELLKLLTNEMIKIKVNDNLQLLSYLRSGTNFIYSLIFLSTYTNVYFKTDIQKGLEQIKDIAIGMKKKTETENGISEQDKTDAFTKISNIVKENSQLLELLNTLYYRDIIGEVIVFILAGTMCVYLSNYLITKINCNYKTKSQIDQSINEYNAIYNENKQQKNKEIVVTQ